MQIKLSENPRDWRKFVIQACGIFALWFGILGWRKLIDLQYWPFVLGSLLLIGVAAWIRPEWFRGVYRSGMMASGWLGERVGQVLLTVIYFLFVVPLGWALRLAGYDPLDRRKPPGKTSYWQTTSNPGKLDRMY